MPLPIAINGVGRIGRALVRRLAGRTDIELVAANDLAGVDQVAALLRRDSFNGAFPGEVATNGDRLVIDGRDIAFYSESDIDRLPWSEHGAQLVIEATGALTADRAALAHLGGGVEHVVLSSNSTTADITVCYGVNHELIDREAHQLISNASCTTNCLAVVAHVLAQVFGIDSALLNTVHCFNNNQNLTDAPHADPRRARAASVNMVPTTTGASKAIGLILPDLAASIDGFAVRVPAAQVSLIDLVAHLESDSDADAVNDAFRHAADGDLRDVLAISDQPLVSTDFIGNPHSAIVDLPLTQVVGGRLARVVAWYDNEMGYASRLVDLAVWLGSS